MATSLNDGPFSGYFYKVALIPKKGAPSLLLSPSKSPTTSVSERERERESCAAR